MKKISLLTTMIFNSILKIAKGTTDRRLPQILFYFRSKPLCWEQGGLLLFCYLVNKRHNANNNQRVCKQRLICYHEQPSFRHQTSKGKEAALRPETQGQPPTSVSSAAFSISQYDNIFNMFFHFQTTRQKTTESIWKRWFCFRYTTE